MIHQFDPSKGQEKISSYSRIAKGSSKNNAKGAQTLVNVQLAGHILEAKGAGDGGASTQVVSRWL
jgi:hypothetical protein